MINLKNMAVLLFSLVVPGLAIAQTEVLYNGIHLPEQWPPRYTEPQKAQDMPIPYLEQKPGVIPVNVGRQLFVDSFLIAEVIRFGQFEATSMADENILAMRQLCRYRDSVVSSRTEIKLRISTIMEQIFPEYEKQFSSLWLGTSMGILEKYLTPENIQNSPIDELFEIIKDKSHNKLTIKKSVSIKDAAADTFGIKIAQDAFAFQLKQLIDRLNFLNEQLEALDHEILSYYEKFDCYLHTIPGIGMIAAQLAAAFLIWFFFLLHYRREAKEMNERIQEMKKGKD